MPGHDDIRWVGLGADQAEVDALIHETLAVLGIDADELRQAFSDCFRVRSEHVPVDRNSYLGGWFDALEWLRVRES